MDARDDGPRTNRFNNWIELRKAALQPPVNQQSSRSGKKKRILRSSRRREKTHLSHGEKSLTWKILNKRSPASRTLDNTSRCQARRIAVQQRAKPDVFRLLDWTARSSQLSPPPPKEEEEESSARLTRQEQHRRSNAERAVNERPKTTAKLEQQREKREKSALM